MTELLMVQVLAGGGCVIAVLLAAGWWLDRHPQVRVRHTAAHGVHAVAALVLTLTHLGGGGGRG